LVLVLLVDLRLPVGVSNCGFTHRLARISARAAALL